ncbi:HEPN domain-containing protein [Brevibacillus centrosporus]|uniref:HEPN domain-containing protein n=1 Tax=Brevibacillus centrosporus TaxID=54910 RepID=UPI003B021B4B
MLVVNGESTISYLSSDENGETTSFTLPTSVKWDFSNRKNRIEITVHNNDHRSRLIDLPMSMWNLTGYSVDDQLMTASGVYYLGDKYQFGETFKQELKFSCNFFCLGSEDEVLDYIEFYIPNLIITFDKYNPIDKTEYTILSLDFSGSTYAISLVSQDERINSPKVLLEKNEDAITVKITISKVGVGITLNEAEQLLENLMNLISIIYGDAVIWSNAIGYKDKSIRIQKFVNRSNYVRLQPPRRLIRTDMPYYLSAYINECFQSFVNLSDGEKKTLMKLSHGIQFSSSRLVFPYPIVVLGSALEEYIDDVLPDLDKLYISKKDKRNLQSSLQEWVEKNLHPLLREDEKQDFVGSILSQKFTGFVQRNLKSRTTRLLEFYQVNFVQEQVNAFVKKRNDAAHGSYHYEGNIDYMLWSTIASYLEIILLKRIGYSGEYNDWTSSPPKYKPLPIG